MKDWSSAKSGPASVAADHGPENIQLYHAFTTGSHAGQGELSDEIQGASAYWKVRQQSRLATKKPRPVDVRKKEPAPVDDNAETLDIKVIARMLGCSESHVRRLAECKRMPRSFKLGRLRRWDRSQVEKWIADGCPDCQKRRRA